jgi:hypothetical protein
MDFIFNDNDTAVVCLVDNQPISRLKLDIVEIALNPLVNRRVCAGSPMCFPAREPMPVPSKANGPAG